MSGLDASEPAAPGSGTTGSTGAADDGLLSHHLAMVVPSTLRGLTAVFGMGTGVAPARWSPAIKGSPEPRTPGPEYLGLALGARGLKMDVVREGITSKTRGEIKLHGRLVRLD